MAALLAHAMLERQWSRIGLTVVLDGIGFAIFWILNVSLTLSQMLLPRLANIRAGKLEEDHTNRIFDFTDIHLEGIYLLIL